MQSSLFRHILDLTLAAWGIIVVLRLFAPYIRLETPFYIERTGLHVTLLGICLGLVAIDAALGGHRGAEEHAVVPVEGLEDEGGRARAPPAEDEGRDRHAPGIVEPG